MLTQEQITQIMQEHGLSPGDAKSRAAIEQFAAAKPNAHIDARFIATLREDLYARTSQTQNKSSNLFSMFMNKILASALVVMIALVAGSFWYIQQNTDKPLFSTNQSVVGGDDNQILSGKYGVTGVAEESFGDLDKVAIVAASGRGNMSTGNNASSAPATEMMTNDQKMAAPSTSVGSGGGDTNLIWPGPQNFVFDYEGTALADLPQTQAVLKRAKPVQSAGIVDRIIGMLSFGLIDMTKFQDIKLQNFAFMEDREYGYGINVDIQNGLVSMYQNWEKWPQPALTAPSCMGMEICPPQNPITIDQLPTDAEAIAIADQFLTDYSISKEGYGTPVVQDSWRIYYERAADKRSYYIPEQVQVLYPIQLEGNPVYDEGGMLTGLNVMVDARTKRVTNMSDLMTKQFEKSEYQGETNAKRILDIAQRGGFRNMPYTEPGIKKTTLILETPQTQMVKIWYSTDNYRSSNELYVPAMVFPIKNWQETGYWRQNVIVPLVSDILDTDNQNGQPIPLDGGPATSDPVTGSGSTEPAVMPMTRE